MAESLNAVCSLLRAGMYRSAAQNVSIAKCGHVESGFLWTQELDLVCQKAIRWVTRGLGTASLKLDLQLGRASATFAKEFSDAAEELHASRLQGLQRSRPRRRSHISTLVSP